MRSIVGFRAAVALLCGLVPALTAVAQPRFVFEQAPGVLPKTVRPEQVDLQFSLDPAQPRFEGQAQMQLRITASRRDLLLHARELSAGSATLVDARGRAQPLRIETGTAPDTWRLVAPRPIAKGRHRLDIGWAGTVRSTGEGLFRAGGARSPMLATQLEAIHARNVFPAFDEPAFRARYRVTVRAPAGLQVLANMPRVAHSVLADGRAEHRFDPTPPMPAYLVAVAVGDFDRLDGRSGETALSIFTERGKSPSAAYAMSATQQLLPYYSDYFAQPYALPKLDQIAVPSARTGAMEDWGLISYIEGALLFDPARDSPERRQRVFSIVAHEIAHQWFGNLVTAASWNDIWLNEAFATWLAEKAMDRFNPDWDIPVNRRLQLERVLARDAGRATRPIQAQSVPESRVFEVFDGITYDKGGAVLTMLEQWMGEDTFRRSLQQYMRDRRMSNATAGDLWHHMSRAAGRDVRPMTRAWTRRVGFPLVDVVSRCEAGRQRLQLRQRRFSLDEADAARAEPADAWPVPVRLARGDERRTVMLDRPALELEAGPCDDTRPWVANAGGGGFYRVRYDPSSSARLVAGFAELGAADQVTLFSDTWALVQAGARPLADGLALLDAVERVKGPGRAVLVEGAAEALSWLRIAAGSPELRQAVEARGRRLMSAELWRLGWRLQAGEPAADARTRAAAIRWLSRWGDADVEQEARRLYDDERAGGAPLAPDIRAAVLEVVGRSADAARFEQLVKQLRETRSNSEQWQLSGALGAVRDPVLAQRALELALDPDLPANIVGQIPDTVARQPQHAARAYDFVRSHWRELAMRAEAGPFGISAWLLPRLTGTWADKASADTLLADQRALAGEDLMAPARQMAERIQRLADWRERHGAELAAALAR